MMQKFFAIIGWLSMSYISPAQQIIAGAGYLLQVEESYSGEGRSLSGNARQPAAFTDSSRFGISFRGQHLVGFQGPAEFLLVAGMSFFSGRLLFAADHSGFGSWSQSQYGIGYGMHVSPMLSIGLKMNVYQMKTSGYATITDFPVEAGIVYKFNSSTTTGISVYNIAGVIRTKPAEHELPFVFTVGGSYFFSKEIVSTLLVSWQEQFPMVIRPSIRLITTKQMEFGIGYASTFSSWNVSVAFRIHDFLINCSLLLNQRIGVTSAMGIEWWNRTKG